MMVKTSLSLEDTFSVQRSLTRSSESLVFCIDAFKTSIGLGLGLGSSEMDWFRMPSTSFSNYSRSVSFASFYDCRTRDTHGLSFLDSLRDAIVL